MIPDRNKAEELLIEGKKLNPEIWVAHSRIVAQFAEKIANRCCGIDADKAYVLGLLHDIGKQYGSDQIRHIYIGYHYMLQLGYDEVARICLTHSFNCHNIHDYVGDFDITGEQLNELKNILAKAVFDDYDLLIQLCDSIAGTIGLMSIEKRAEDIKSRHGKYPENKLEKNFELKKYFEKKMNEELYDVLSL